MCSVLQCVPQQCTSSERSSWKTHFMHHALQQTPFSRPCARSPSQARGAHCALICTARRANSAVCHALSPKPASNTIAMQPLQHATRHNQSRQSWQEPSAQTTQTACVTSEPACAAAALFLFHPWGCAEHHTAMCSMQSHQPGMGVTSTTRAAAITCLSMHEHDRGHQSQAPKMPQPRAARDSISSLLDGAFASQRVHGPTSQAPRNVPRVKQ